MCAMWKHLQSSASCVVRAPLPSRVRAVPILESQSRHLNWTVRAETLKFTSEIFELDIHFWYWDLENYQSWGWWWDTVFYSPNPDADPMFLTWVDFVTLTPCYWHEWTLSPKKYVYFLNAEQFRGAWWPDADLFNFLRNHSLYFLNYCRNYFAP